MNKKIIFLFLFAVMGFFLSSCGHFNAGDNKKNLAKIRIGMTKAEVRAIMGEPPKESYQSRDIWFYYTDPKWYDGCITRDECTPFVFDPAGGYLVGFGYEYYKKNYSLADWSQKSADADLRHAGYYRSATDEKK